MISRSLLAAITALVLCCACVATAADPIRIEGAFGFGFESSARGGRFPWDWTAARTDTALVDLKLGASPGRGIDAYVAFSSGLEPHGARFTLREAAFDAAWRHTEAGDSAAIHLFAFQPSRLWLDLPLQAPLDADAFGGDAVHGARADAAWHSFIATALAVRAGENDVAANAAWLARARWDGWHPARLGATWTRHLPDAARTRGDAAIVDPLRRDVLGVDARAAWRTLIASVEFSDARDAFAVMGAAQTQEPGRRTRWGSNRSRRITDILPTTATLRAELRATALGGERWGRIGVAPAYRALGAHSGSRLQVAERDRDAPRRGLEGYRLEAWYEPPGLPGWIRQVYDRHQQFRDADRRILVQQTEIEGRLTTVTRGRLRYVQHAVRDRGRSRDTRTDYVLGDVVAEDRGGRFRLAAGLLDLDTVREARVLALEWTANLGARAQVVGRWTAQARDGDAEQAAFVALQYWHGSQFEAALQWGPEWIGDTVDPVLDPDLRGDPAPRDAMRIHVRGWF